MSKKHVKKSEKSDRDSKETPTVGTLRHPTTLDIHWRNTESLTLSRELRTYASVLDRLLSQEGDYVLIKENEVIGIYPSREFAVSQAIDRFGAEPVLIKQIVAIEPVLEIGHVTL